jgi:hypothetical protein
VAELFLRRTLSGFAPADEQAEAAVRGFKVGGTYRAKVVKPRSYQHHKLIMALLTLTYRNLPEKIEINGNMVATADLWKSFDSFRRSIAIEAGHVEIVITRDGQAHNVPGSLSYDALDEIEFTRVSAAMMSVCAQILDMSEPELAGEVSRYADHNYGMVANG